MGWWLLHGQIQDRSKDQILKDNKRNLYISIGISFALSETQSMQMSYVFGKSNDCFSKQNQEEPEEKHWVFVSELSSEC